MKSSCSCSTSNRTQRPGESIAERFLLPGLFRGEAGLCVCSHWGFAFSPPSCSQHERFIPAPQVSHSYQWSSVLLVIEEGTRTDGRSSDFGTGCCVQECLLHYLLHWKLFWSFPLLQDDFRPWNCPSVTEIASKKHIITQKLGFQTTMLIARERKYLLAALFQTIELETPKQQEGKSEFRFLQAEDLHGFSNDKYMSSCLTEDFVSFQNCTGSTSYSHYKRQLYHASKENKPIFLDIMTLKLVLKPNIMLSPPFQTRPKKRIIQRHPLTS